jgi:hypothetical protein
MTDLFSKILVGRHSPENKCHVDDGTVLFVRPRETIPQRDLIPHHFLSTSDRKTQSKYGWVEATYPLSLNDFIGRHLAQEPLTKTEREHLETMLQSAAKLPVGTPVAASYGSRGLERKRMVFTVHRVIFHRD